MSNPVEESILALATEAANDRAKLRAENARLCDQRDKLLAACEALIKWDRSALDRRQSLASVIKETKAAIAAAKKGK